MPDSKILDNEFKDFEDIKFVSVEIINKDAVFEETEKIDCGLFLGILEKETDNPDNSKFLGIICSSSTIKLFNVTEYNVLSVNVLEGITRHTIIYGSCDGDQVQALEDLNILTSMLNKAGRMCKDDPKEEIIDVDTYTEYEDEIVDEVEVNRNTNNKTSTNTTSNTNTKTSTSTNNYTKTTTDNTPKVFKIRRKGKMPSFERIDSMKQKVKNLAGLEVKVAVLKCDMPDDKKEVNKPIDNQEIDDYYERMYGMM